MDAQSSNLLPCPFCGGEAAFLGETATIKCKQCGGAFFVTNPGISRYEAAKAWNTRHESKRDCPYCPDIEQQTRINCHLHKPKKED